MKKIIYAVILPVAALLLTGCFGNKLAPSGGDLVIMSDDSISVFLPESTWYEGLRWEGCRHHPDSINDPYCEPGMDCFHIKGDALIRFNCEREQDMYIVVRRHTSNAHVRIIFGALMDNDCWPAADGEDRDSLFNAIGSKTRKYKGGKEYSMYPDEEECTLQYLNLP